jgi:hypothetical protein
MSNKVLISILQAKPQLNGLALNIFYIRGPKFGLRIAHRLFEMGFPIIISS